MTRLKGDDPDVILLQQHGRIFESFGPHRVLMSNDCYDFLVNLKIPLGSCRCGVQTPCTYEESHVLARSEKCQSRVL